MAGTMVRTMAAGSFKSHCLAVLDEVQRRREPVLVTKNGRPVAKMVPLDLPEEQDPLDLFGFGGVEVLGDLVSPVYTSGEWDEFCEASADDLR